MVNACFCKQISYVVETGEVNFTMLKMKHFIEVVTDPNWKQILLEDGKNIS